MNEEDNHGGITIGALGIINRHARIREMEADVDKNGRKSKYYKWHQDRQMLSWYIHDLRIKRYNKLPKWLKWIMKNPTNK